jgi:hypothetical protein
VLAGRRLALSGAVDLLEPHLTRLFGFAVSRGEAPPSAEDFIVTIERGAVQSESPREPQIEMILDRLVWGQLREGALELCDARSSIRVDYERRTLSVVVADDGAASRYVLGHHMFPIGLGELLRSTGTYWVHAGAIVRDGRAVLLVGDSGAGKSTFSYQAIRSGLRCIADDAVLISSGPDGSFLCHPFYREFSLDPDLLSAADRPRAARVEPTPRGDRFRVELLDEQYCDFAPIEAIAVITQGALPSRVTACSAAAAIAALAAQNRFLMVHPALADAHLRCLARLTLRCRPAILTVARDVLELPERVRELLDRLLTP